MLDVLVISSLLSTFLIIYHHALYPLLLRLAERGLPARQLLAVEGKPYAPDSATRPFFSILVPAFNEARFIHDKLVNLACLDYPAERFNIVIACDGCQDDTANIARAFRESELARGLHIQILEFQNNRGKCAVINAVVPSLQADIIALTDVSALVSIDALKVAETNFREAEVGAVNGNYRLLHASGAGEQQYWQYQSHIKRAEERLGSVLGAHGAFYCLRKNLFQRLPADTINDDFVIPMRVIEQGYRVVYEPRINALELEQSSNAQDWKRRQRIGMGNVQQVLRLRRLFTPRYSGVAFTFFSGKGLRVLMPVFMVYVFVSSAMLNLWADALAPSSALFFQCFFSAQCAVYALAATVALSRARFGGRVGKIVFYLVSGHLANLIGACRFLFKQKTQW